MKNFSYGSVPDLNFQLAVKKPIPIRCVKMEEAFKVETPEGILEGRAGDYLMVGVRNELYPCSKEIFEETYEIIE